MDILHPKAQQGEEHDDGLLLIPCDVKGYRQLVNISSTEDLFELQGHHSPRIAVVALSGVENAGNTIDVAEVELVVLIFSAARGEDDHILRQCLCEVGIVVTALHTAIATAHDDELTDSTALDSLHDLVSKGEDLIVGEAADDLSVLDLLGSLALASHLDDLREVLMAVGACGDMLPSWEARRVGCEHTTGIVSLR